MVGTHGHFIDFLYIFMLDFFHTFFNQLEICPLLLKELIAIAH